MQELCVSAGSCDRCAINYIKSNNWRKEENHIVSEEVTMFIKHDNDKDELGVVIQVCYPFLPAILLAPSSLNNLTTESDVRVCFPVRNL